LIVYLQIPLHGVTITSCDNFCRTRVFLGLVGWDGVKADSAFSGDIIDSFEGPSDTDSAACMGGIEEISLVTGAVIVVKG
jgi:hypothetical protein